MQLEKRLPYNFGVGKRYVQACPSSSLTDLSRSDYRLELEKREPYNFGVGKRLPYNFGVGKRSGHFPGVLGRRSMPYNFGVGR